MRKRRHQSLSWTSRPIRTPPESPCSSNPADQHQLQADAVLGPCLTVTARTINVPRRCTLISNALLRSRSPVLAAGLPVHDPSSWENIPPNSHKGCMRGLQSLTSSVQRNLCTTSHPICLWIRGNSSSRVGAPGE